MKSEDHKKIFKQICDFLGEDIDTPLCKEVANHLEKCPDCKVQFDTIRKTVTLCREKEETKKVPDDVTQRLIKTLNLNKSTDK